MEASWICSGGEVALSRAPRGGAGSGGAPRGDGGAGSTRVRAGCVLGHDGNALGVDGVEVGVLEEPDEVGLG